MRDLFKKCSSESHPEIDIVWITSQFPLGIRPVPRFKQLVPKPLKSLPEDEYHWVPVSEQQLISFQRPTNYAMDRLYKSHQASRCENWSTLRQMLPTTGFPKRQTVKSWGGAPVTYDGVVHRISDNLPLINSAMTQFVDDVHKLDPLFRLYTSR